ncbi:jg8746, partial [Pararge aegeria aegeria]
MIVIMTLMIFHHCIQWNGVENSLSFIWEHTGIITRSQSMPTNAHCWAEAYSPLGEAALVIVYEFSSDEDVNQFFEALGSGSKEDLIDDDSTQMYTRENMSTVYFYKVLVGDEIDLVQINKPFRQRHLSSEDVFILDTPCSGVYVWLGKDVDPEVKRSYNNIAQQYLDVKGYPAW